MAKNANRNESGNKVELSAASSPDQTPSTSAAATPPPVEDKTDSGADRNRKAQNGEDRHGRKELDSVEVCQFF